MAIRTTAEAVAVPPAEAIAFLRQKLNVTSRHWTDVWQEANVRSFAVAGAASEALVADFRDAVARALEQGTTLATFRGEFDRLLAEHGWVYNGTPAWRAQIIYETNLSVAYSAGRYAQMTEPATLAAFPYWQYMHTSSAHPRPAHLAWVGTTLRADDPWWSSHYPPNGWNCRCGVRPVSGRGLTRMGKTGPDQAPPIETRPWTNPRTGKVVQVPEGIDPGWAYNPGQAWLEGRTAPPAPAAPKRPLEPLEPRPERLPGQTTTPLAAPSVQAADRALAPLWKPWADGLSEREAQLVEAYKTAAGRPMNKVLRGYLADPALAEAAAELDAAVSRAVAPEAVRTFRGVGAEEARKLFGTRVVGDLVADPAFLSTSLSPSVAERFAAQGGTRITVLVPRGLKGAAYIHPFPRHRFPQYELILRPGTALRILTLGLAGIVVEAENGPDEG